MTRKAFSLLVVCSAAVCLPGAVSAADAIAPIGRHVERVALPAVSSGFGSNIAGATIVGHRCSYIGGRVDARTLGADTATPSKQAPHSAGHACHPGS